MILDEDADPVGHEQQKKKFAPDRFAPAGWALEPIGGRWRYPFHPPLRHPSETDGSAQLPTRRGRLRGLYIDVHIRRLRKALEESGYDRLIQTVRGSGYRLSSRPS